MIYNRTTWENSPSTSTPINAQNLNKIEQGISDATNEINAISHVVNVGTEVDEDYRVNFIHSRNLWKQLPNTQTLNGITLTNNGNGTFNLSGTATANTSFYAELDLGSTNLKDGTYTLSKKSAGHNIQLDFYNGTTYVSTPIYCYGSTLENSATLSIGSNVNKVRYIIYVANGSSVSLTNEEIMLNEGSEALPFEPYNISNQIVVDNEKFADTLKVGTDVDGRSRVNALKSKNLFNKNTALLKTGINGSTGATTTNNNSFVSDFIKVDKNTDYYISGSLTSVYGYSSDFTFLSTIVDTSGAKTFNSGNAEYVRVKNWYAPDTSAMQSQLNTSMMNVGTSALPYEPYTQNQIVVDNETFTDTINVGHLDSRSRVNVLKSNNLLDLQFLQLIVNQSGTVITNNSYWDVIVDTRKISNLYVSGNFSLLADNTIRIGTYSTYPVLGSTGTRITLQANGVIDTSSVNYVLFAFGVSSSSVTIDQVKSSFMINEGTSALPYEPYVTPSINVDGEEIYGQQYCNSSINSDATITSGSSTYSTQQLLLDKISTYGNFSLSSNSIVIGKGIKQILVSLNINIFNATDNHFYNPSIRLYRDGTRIDQINCPRYMRNIQGSYSISPYIFDVQENDVIKCEIQIGSASETFKVSKDGTNLLIQKIK